MVKKKIEFNKFRLSEHPSKYQFNKYSLGMFMMSEWSFNDKFRNINLLHGVNVLNESIISTVNAIDGLLRKFNIYKNRENQLLISNERYNYIPFNISIKHDGKILIKEFAQDDKVFNTYYQFKEFLIEYLKNNNYYYIGYNLINKSNK